MNKKIVIIFSAIGIAITVFAIIRTNANKGPVIEPLTEKWELTVPYQKVPIGLSSLSAEECGMCHKDHYEEWKVSTHASAWTDEQFQSEIAKESSPFFCINCHIPLENQQEYIVSGYIDGDLYNPARTKNPKWDKKLQQEGITCAACHVRSNSIVGPTGTSKAPHMVVKDTDHLSESLCINCHNAKAVITETLACSFETGDEWSSGPYAETKNCISCHMEEVDRSIVAGYEPRKSHFHSFPGAGISKHDTIVPHRLESLEFTPGEHRNDYSSENTIEFSLKLKNAHAGHRVPSGDPERFILINFKVINLKGEIVDEQTSRIGEKWQWHPTAKKLTDNNLNPGEERTFTYESNSLKKGAYELIVEVSKHRSDEKTAKYNKLSAHYPLMVSVYKEKYKFSVR